jgi:hypothetical protein
MSIFIRRYNTLLDLATAGSERIRIPIRKAGSNDFATGSDYTYVSGDVKVSKDGAAQQPITNAPTFNNGSWEFTLTAAELSARCVEVRIVDSATKAVDDEGFNVETFGNASAMWPTDYGDVVRLGMTALPNAAAGTTGGQWPFVATAGTSQANPSPVVYNLKLASAAASTDDRYTHCPIFIGNKWRKIKAYIGATREADIDDSAGLSPGNTTYSYTILDGPTLDTDTVQTLVNAPPDSSGLSTVNNNILTVAARIGAFTGTGLNTILGFFRASLRKDAALTPSDVGGAFDNTTDSNEAIRDRGDVAWLTGGGSGLSGPSSVTLTFHDAGGNPVPLVDFTIIGQGSDRAGSDGVKTFGLPNGSYTVVARITNAVVFGNTALVVSGTTPLTITGTGQNIAAQTDPGLTNAYTTLVRGNGTLAANETVKFRAVRGGATDPRSYDHDRFNATSDANGLLVVPHVKGGTYTARWANGKTVTYTVPTNAAGTWPIAPTIPGEDDEI